MQKKNKKAKIIVLIAIIVLLLLLIILSGNIKKSYNKNELALYEISVTGNPNIPKVVAGMIPVKYVNGNWAITTVNDPDWYNYSSGKPAYVMLNDGTYQSELTADMTNKKLASENLRSWST